MAFIQIIVFLLVPAFVNMLPQELEYTDSWASNSPNEDGFTSSLFFQGDSSSGTDLFGETLGNFIFQWAIPQSDARNVYASSGLIRLSLKVQIRMMAVFSRTQTSLLRITMHRWTSPPRVAQHHPIPTGLVLRALTTSPSA